MSSVFLESKITTVRVALAVRDTFTNSFPTGVVDVTLSGLNVAPFRHPEGYLLWMDIPDADYTVQVGAEFYDYYDSLVVNPASLDLVNGVPFVDLQPNPNYVFPDGSTLVSGVVKDQNDNPVANADITVQGRSEMARTDAMGRYVLPFANLTSPENLTVDVSKGGYLAQSDIVSVQPFETVTADFVIALLSDPSTAILIGTITDNFDDPVTQAQVAVVGDSVADQTDLAGQTVLAVVLGSPTENVDITIDQVGFEQGQVTVSASQGQTTNFAFEMDTDFNNQIARLRVRSRDPSGDIPGALVEVIEKNRVAITADDDERARFYFDDLASDTEDVTIRVSKAGYITQTVVEEIEKDKEKSYDVTLTPEP